MFKNKYKPFYLIVERRGGHEFASTFQPGITRHGWAAWQGIGAHNVSKKKKNKKAAKQSMTTKYYGKASVRHNA
jgi:hypothetical protein